MDFHHLMFIVCKMLRDNDGSALLGDVREYIRKREGAAITPEWETRVISTGLIKWVNRLYAASDVYAKAGFLRKPGGVWHLTPDGEEALLLGEQQFIAEAKRRASQVRRAQQRENAAQTLPTADGDASEASNEEVQSAIGIEQYQDTAMSSIVENVRALGPYEFQNLCAALLRGMGYHVRDVAAPGPDGGIDIVAYTDPLGAHPPRVKVQVKHRAAVTGTPDLQNLIGALAEGDIALFVSSSGFAAGCRSFARNNSKHLELIDLPRFIELWREHYGKLSEEDKSLLPLQAIYFLDEKRAKGDS